MSSYSRQIELPESQELVGMGWLPDLPDIRDYSVDTKDPAPKLQARGKKASIISMLGELKLGASETASFSASGDLTQWFSPIENQGALGSCTANAGVGLVEYFERRAFGKHIDESRLFLYKTTRNLLGLTGDTGAFIRTTMGAMALFGVPPEKYHPYIIADFDNEPSAFCYAFAQNYQALQYFRLDPPGIDREVLLKRIRAFIAAGVPVMFGFTVYDSIRQAAKSGKIPFPCRRDRVAGGHAVVAMGFDDAMEIENTNCGLKTKGALKIRNSWGARWGERGYGWLPYDYVRRGLARDWWSLLKNEWVDTGKFGL